MNNYYLQLNESTEILNLDKFSDYDLDLPSGDYNLIDNVGYGSQITGIGSLKGRRISLKYFFNSNDFYEHDEVLDWFTKSVGNTVYLYKQMTKRFLCDISSGSTIIIPQTTSLVINQFSDILDLKTMTISSGINGISTGTNITSLSSGSSAFIISNAATNTIVGTEIECEVFLGRLEVHPQLSGGETWNNSKISKDIKFDLFSTSAFFQSTSLLSKSIVISSTAQYSTTLNLVGFKSPAIYQISSTQSFDTFQVKLYEGYGFKASYTFSSSTDISVDTRNSNLTLNIEGNEIYSNVFNSNSSPFTLERGSNELFITSCPSTLYVKWYERQL